MSIDMEGHVEFIQRVDYEAAAWFALGFLTGLARQLSDDGYRAGASCEEAIVMMRTLMRLPKEETKP